jgi:hypothetical protein
MCHARGSRTARAALTVAGLAAGFWLAATFANSAAAYADAQPDPTPAISTSSAATDQQLLPSAPTVLGDLTHSAADASASSGSDGSGLDGATAPKSDLTPPFGSTDNPSETGNTGKTKPRSGGLLDGVLSGTVGSLGAQVDKLAGGHGSGGHGSGGQGSGGHGGGGLGSIIDLVIPHHSLPIGDDPQGTPVPIFDGYPGHLPCCIPDLPWSPPGHPAPPRIQPAGGAAGHGSGIPAAGSLILLTSPRASQPAVRAPRTTVQVPVVARLFSASGAPVGPGSIPVQPLIMVASVAGHAGSDASAWLDPLGSSGLGSAPMGPVGTDDLFILHTTAKPSVSPD